MSIRNLRSLFQPASVAVIGASERQHAVGMHVWSNLVEGGYQGTLYAVNPKHATIGNAPCHRDLGSLPAAPDLAVICTPAATVPGLIAELGAMGTRAAVVLSAGMSAPSADGSGSLRQTMLNAARPHLLRVLGPNCLGMLVPGLKLNASFAPAMALPGRLAFVSQSGALATAVLDWANGRNIGFSHFVSLGESADVDLGDMLDYLADDAATSAILLYVESVTAARKFMSAARRAARNRPVVVVKGGRVPEGARAAATHSGALAGSDIVFDAAIRRAGMLRVDTMAELFDAVETLARARPLHGERLLIMTNGGGTGVMATDALVRHGGTLAGLDAATEQALDAVLPTTWSHANPIDIVGDAPVGRYVDAIDVLMRDPGSDAVLFVHAPTAIVPSDDIAAALCPHIADQSRNVFSAWVGGPSVRSARRRFRKAGIPTYDTPEQAVGAFLHTVEYHRNQALLSETPAADAGPRPHDAAGVRHVAREALAAGRAMLTGVEAMEALRAYGIPVVPIHVAHDADEAVVRAGAVGYPVAVKVHSPQISHKSDVGGVALDLGSPEQVRQAIQAMAGRVAYRRPDARIEGYIVQPMLRRPHAQELIVGTAVDPVFGPIVLFGEGGTAVEVLADRAVALVPLNEPLARDMVARTRVAARLAGYRDRAAADHQALYGVLMQVSQLMCDVPEIVGLDINPLLTDAEGAVALDARIRVAPYASGRPADRLAILPYPCALEEVVRWDGATVLLRPVRPGDEPMYARFMAALTRDDLHHRFFGMARQFRQRELARMVQLDYDREMAFVAISRDVDGVECMLGEVRAMADPDNEVAEFALLVRSDLKNRGLGTLLLTRLIRYCGDRGTGALVGDVLADNVAMLHLGRRCGFVTLRKDAGAEVRIRLEIRAARAKADRVPVGTPPETA